MSWIECGTLAWLTVPSFLVIYYWIWSRSRLVRLVNRIPGPNYFPLLGNLLDLNVDFDEFLKIVHFDWIRKFGNIYRVWRGVHPIVAISSPELMEPIIASQKLITKGIEYSYFSPWLGNCMFLMTGVQWKNRRRFLAPAFHFQILNSFMDVYNEKSIESAKNMEKFLENQNGCEFDVYPHMTQCALDIICETSMGLQTRSQAEKEVYIKNVHRIGQIIMERYTRPWLAIDWIFNLSAIGREQDQCVQALHNFTNQVIRDRRNTLRKEKKQRNIQNKSLNNNEISEKIDGSRQQAFLDLLINASENGADLNDDDIREEVDTFMLAGHHTTASALTWFLYCIAKHPEKQQLVIEEVDQVFGGSARSCTTQDNARLKYLECCIKETLRLYPSIPVVMRYLTEDVKLGDYILPTGVSVNLMIYGMHHSPLIYPDPEAFRPERFLPENSIGRHPYAFIPFSAGPRNCIGQKFAMMELKVILANLLRRFRFSVADPTQPLLLPSSELVLKPQNGVPLIVSKRLDVAY